MQNNKKLESKSEAKLKGSGAVAQGNESIAAGKAATVITNSTVIVAKDGARIIIGEQPVQMASKLRKTPLGRYLEYIIAHNSYLQVAAETGFVGAFLLGLCRA